MITINLYGDIGSEVNVGEVVEQLQAAKGEPVTLRINSNGGDLSGGIAIYNTLREMSGVTAVVDGFAASAATLIMLGADRVEMPENGWLLLHQVSTKIEGTAEDFQKGADLLKANDQALVDIYARETGNPPEKVRNWMSARTWFDAATALANGLIDIITGPAPIKASLASFARFGRVPDALKAQLDHPDPNPKTKMRTILQALVDAKLLNCSCMGNAAPKEEEITEELKSSLEGLTAERDSLKARLEAVEKELAGMKASSATTLQARAAAAVDGVIAEGRLVATLRPVLIEAYVKDEAGTIGRLAELPRASAGTAPLPRGTAGDVVKSLKEKIEAEPDLKKRIQLYNANWGQVASAPA